MEIESQIKTFMELANKEVKAKVEQMILVANEKRLREKERERSHKKSSKDESSAPSREEEEKKRTAYIEKK